MKKPRRSPRFNWLSTTSRTTCNKLPVSSRHFIAVNTVLALYLNEAVNPKAVSISYRAAFCFLGSRRAVFALRVLHALALMVFCFLCMPRRHEWWVVERAQFAPRQARPGRHGCPRKE